MSFTRPTLPELITRVTDDLNSRIDGSNLRRTNNEVLARVLAGAVHMLHGHLDFVSKQVIIDTASDEALDQWANVWGLSRKPGTFAIGQVVITGAIGSEISEGVLLSGANGVEYQTSESRILATTSESIPVISSTAGLEGNVQAGETLTLQAPIIGVESNTVVDTEGITGGDPQESDDALRERLLLVIQNPPRGGTITDYKTWASSVEGVGKVFVTPLIQGPGTVGVSFLTNDPENIIPNSTKIQEVQDYIDSEKPVTANVLVFAPTTVELDVTISNLVPDTPEVRQAIKDEIGDVILREAEPGGTILLSHLNEAASIATGEVDHQITAPTGNVTSALDEILIPGEVTFA